MRKVIVIVSMLISVEGYSQSMDYFNQDILQLARMVWDKSVDSAKLTWVRNCTNSTESEKRIWAYMVIGVHLQDIKFKLNSSGEHLGNFDKSIIYILNKANDGINIDSNLQKQIDLRILVKSINRDHAMVYPDDFIHEILLIRQIKHERYNDIRFDSIKLYNFLFSTIRNEIAYLSRLTEQEMLNTFTNYTDNKINYNFMQYFSEAFKTYRGTFINVLEKYYNPTEFNKLSFQSQLAILDYWLFNLDLINQTHRLKIFDITEDSNSSTERIENRLKKTMLNCLIENCSREQYRNEVSKFGDKAAKEKMLNDIKIRMRN